MAADPLPWLIALAAVSVTVLAVLAAAIAQIHRRAAEQLAAAARAHAEAAEDHIDALRRAAELEAHLTGLRTQLVLTLGAQERIPTGPRCN